MKKTLHVLKSGLFLTAFSLSLQPFRAIMLMIRWKKIKKDLPEADHDKLKLFLLWDCLSLVGLISILTLFVTGAWLWGLYCLGFNYLVDVLTVLKMERNFKKMVAEHKKKKEMMESMITEQLPELKNQIDKYDTLIHDVQEEILSGDLTNIGNLAKLSSSKKILEMYLAQFTKQMNFDIHVIPNMLENMRSYYLP